MAVSITLTHPTIKIAGQKLHAIADWNANHQLTADLDIGSYDFITNGNIYGTTGYFTNIQVANALFTGSVDIDYDLTVTGLITGGNFISIGYIETSNVSMQDAETGGTDNLFVGINAAGAGNNEGDYNTFIGKNAGYHNILGYYNYFGGYNAGYNNEDGFGNFFLGAKAGLNNVDADANIYLGYYCAYLNEGSYNTVVGRTGGYKMRTGSYNCFVGQSINWLGGTDPDYNVVMGMSAGSYLTGDRNVFIGYESGYYETASDRLFIDDRQRTSEADGRAKALIYGIFADAIANQYLYINGNLFITQIKSGATQGAAGAAANELWKTASHATLPDNVLMIGV